MSAEEVEEEDDSDDGFNFIFRLTRKLAVLGFNKYGELGTAPAEGLGLLDFFYKEEESAIAEHFQKLFGDFNSV